MKWDGIERRLPSQDHDLLTRIDVKLTDFLEKFNELKRKVDWHDKVIYIGLGGLTVVEFLMKLVK